MTRAFCILRAVRRPATLRTRSTTERRLSTAEDGGSDRRLLSAAASLFRTTGYTATTTRELARRLGIRSASLYYHIGKKEDLLYEISVASLDRLQGIVGSAIAAESDPLERVRVLIRTHLRTALADTDAHLTMLLELRSLSPRRRATVIALRDRYEKLVRRVVATAQDAGTLRRDVRPKFLALALLNLVNWSIFWYRPRGGLSAEALGALLEDLFVEGARRPMGRTGRGG